MLKMQ